MKQEKRGHPRIHLKSLVHVIVNKISNEELDSSVRFNGDSKDISVSGIRFYGKHPLSKGNQLGLTVEVGSEKANYKLSGSVMWVSETTEREFIAGFEIDASSVDYSRWLQIFK
ncbi:MAG: PilZ domain-containing protein [Kangiellaceae bacterium]|nr:PilZ domain-containing protein [Kangiellaceae bacterium]